VRALVLLVFVVRLDLVRGLRRSDGRVISDGSHEWKSTETKNVKDAHIRVARRACVARVEREVG
jgi:hypothetical protein